MKKLLVLVVLACSAIAAAQTVEVTKQDFLKLDTIRASQLSTFGVTLGMDEDAALQALRDHGLAADKDKSQPGERESTITGGFGSEQPAIQLGVANGKVTRIAWLPPMEKRLAGSAKQLFDKTIMERDSALRLQLLGREDDARVKLPHDDILQISTLTYIYAKEGIRVIHAITKSAQMKIDLDLLEIDLVAPERAR